MRVLVTGGAGFIGRVLVKRLLSRGWEVVNLDLLTYAAQKPEPAAGMQLVVGDVSDPEVVAFAMMGVEGVFHLAAESHVDRSIRGSRRFLETNVVGTGVLLEAAAKAGISRFLYVSTDEVYGDLAPDLVATESCSLHPSNPYAASKAGAELVAASFFGRIGCR